MKQFEEKTLEEIIASGNKEELKRYYEYVESMKTNSFYRNIVASYEGKSIEEITYGIIDDESPYRSEVFFPGEVALFYPRIKEQRAKDFITCDFSAGIIKPGSIYLNYRPLIYNITSGETYVLQRTLKVEAGYSYELPTSIVELEALDSKLRIYGYADKSGIEYSHLSQRLGGEISLQKLKRRGKNENRSCKWS